MSVVFWVANDDCFHEWKFLFYAREKFAFFLFSLGLHDCELISDDSHEQQAKSQLWTSRPNPYHYSLPAAQCPTERKKTWLKTSLVMSVDDAKSWKWESKWNGDEFTAFNLFFCKGRTERARWNRFKVNYLAIHLFWSEAGGIERQKPEKKKGTKLKMAFNSQIWSSWHKPKQRKLFILVYRPKFLLFSFFLFIFARSSKWNTFLWRRK